MFLIEEVTGARSRQTAAATVFEMRFGGGPAYGGAEADVSGVVTPGAPRAVEAPGEAREQEAEAPPRPAPFSVDLIPGSSRIVTSIVNPMDGSVLFRIPAWWTDLEGALETTPQDRTYA